MPDARLLAGVYATRTDFGVDDAIAAIVNDIGGAVSTAVAIAGKPVVVVMTMMTPMAVMAPVAMTMTAMMATEVVTAAVEATAAATMTASGRGSGESCGRNERDDDESKFTKHFNLQVWCALHRFNAAKLCRGHGSCCAGGHTDRCCSGKADQARISFQAKPPLCCYVQAIGKTESPARASSPGGGRSCHHDRDHADDG